MHTPTGARRRGVCVRTVKSKQTYTLIMLTRLNPGFSVHSRYVILAFVPVSFRTDFKVLLLVIKCLHLLPIPTIKSKGWGSNVELSQSQSYRV